MFNPTRRNFDSQIQVDDLGQFDLEAQNTPLLALQNSNAASDPPSNGVEEGPPTAAENSRGGVIERVCKLFSFKRVVVIFLLSIGIAGIIWAELHWHLITSIALLATVIIVLTFYSVGHLGRFDKIRFILSVLLNKTATVYPDTVVFRQEFAELQVPVATAKSAHTHSDAATNRTSVIYAFHAFAMAVGRDIWFHQLSATDEKAGRDGSRTYYWTKDLSVAPRQDEPPQGCVVAMVDTDYYLDLPERLALRPNVHCIYAFQPHEVASSDSEISFTFLENGEVKYMVNGGAIYQHHVWNFAVDEVTVSAWDGWVPTVTNYLVERKILNPSREAIMLTPTHTWRGLWVILVRWLKQGPLVRLDLRDKGFNRLMVRRAGKLLISTGVQGDYNCTTISASLDNTVRNLCELSKHDVTIYQTESLLSAENPNLDKIDVKRQSAVLTRYHQLKSRYKAPVVFPPERSIRRYQFGTYDETAPETLDAFMSPLVEDCYVPDMTIGNERQAVKGRITDKVNNKPASAFTIQAIREFSEKFAPFSGILTPYDENEVYDRQNTPGQRRILDDGSVCFYQRNIKAFQKKEAYSKPTDPRLISTINGRDKLRYSQYIYAISDYMKHFEWYAFGTTPKRIAERVAKVASESRSHVMVTDYSRFDGTIGPALRLLEISLLLRLFPHCYHDEVRELHRSQYGMRAVLTLGTTYEQGTARASGSPETSVFNSIENAFVVYFAWRRTICDGSFCGPERAWNRLNAGIFGGDDGLVADVPAPNLVSAAKSLGLTITADEIVRGKLGVKFLSRIFGPYVWTGDPNSCADLWKQLSKFHTIRKKSVPDPKTSILEKAMGYALMDPNTPFLGCFCQKIMTFKGKREITPNAWLAQYDLSEQFPNYRTAWMDAYAEKAVPGADVVRFEAWVYSLTTLVECLCPPLLVEPKPPAQHKTQAVYVNGEHIAPATPRAASRDKSTSTTRIARDGVRQRRGRGSGKPVNKSAAEPTTDKKRPRDSNRNRPRSGGPRLKNSKQT